MALFSKKQKPRTDIPGVIMTEDEILGFLDELFNQRTPLTIRTKEKQWDCNIYFIDVKSKLLRIEDTYGLLEYDRKGVQCGFPMDRTWFLFQSKLIFYEGKPHLVMPSAIKQAERRKNPRSAFSPREEVSVSVLQTLGAGIGVTGTVTDVSAGGICLTIERALKLENEKQVTVRSDLLPKGTELMLVKVKGIPGVPTFETRGIVNRVSGPGKWKLAIELPKIPAPIKAAIEKFVQSRYHKPIPIRRSYQKRQEMQKQREQEREQEKQETALQESRQQPEARKNIKFVDDISPEAVEQMTGASLEPEPEPEPEPRVKPEPRFEPEPQFEPEPEFAPDGEGMALPSEPLKPILISLGEQLQEQLAFLADVEQYEWVHVDTPVKIIRFLRERKTDFLLLPLVYKRQGMLEYLEKVSNMGLLQNVSIIILTGEQISPKDMVKCRMLQIQHIIELPLPTPDQVLDIITSKSADAGSSDARL